MGASERRQSTALQTELSTRASVPSLLLLAGPEGQWCWRARRKARCLQSFQPVEGAQRRSLEELEEPPGQVFLRCFVIAAHFEAGSALKSQACCTG